jgi:CBS-domain-containing membrane protein
VDNLIITLYALIGATALLAAVNTEIRDIGWYYLPVVLLTSALALVVALITNNIQRRYPVFWFYPSPPKPIVSPEKPQIDNTIKESREGTLKEKDHCPV